MKKILFVCDADNFPSGAFQFITSLRLSENFLLTGAFFHSINYDMVFPASYTFSPDPLIAFTDADVKAVTNSIEQFEKKCVTNHIEYRVHEESDHFKINDLVKESRFADLLVLSEELFFSHIDGEQPNKYMQQVLHRSECPLLVVPEKYYPFNRITAAYDGRKESMYALKQFCYLLPDFAEYPVELLYVQEQRQSEIPEYEYVEEFAARHFSSPTLHKIDFVNKDYLTDWLDKKPDTLLVTGSYSHSGLFTAVKESFIDKTINRHKVPIFIAHNA